MKWYFKVLIVLLILQLLLLTAGTWFFEFDQTQQNIGWVVFLVIVACYGVAIAHDAHATSQMLCYHILNEVTSEYRTKYQILEHLYNASVLNKSDPDSAEKTMQYTLDLLIDYEYIERKGMSDIYFRATDKGKARYQELAVQFG